jgi:hypothetical protein
VPRMTAVAGSTERVEGKCLGGVALGRILEESVKSLRALPRGLAPALWSIPAWIDACVRQSRRGGIGSHRLDGQDQGYRMADPYRTRTRDGGATGHSLPHSSRIS